MAETTQDILIESLGKCIDAISPVKKTKENPFFEHRYADLNSVLNAIRKPLHDNGLYITQLPDSEGIVTKVIHRSSATFLQCTTPIPYHKLKPHEVGSWISYMRRYALISIFCIPQEDDDGNTAQTGAEASELAENFVKTYDEDVSRLGNWEALKAHYIKHKPQIDKLPKTYKNEVMDLFIIQKEKIADADKQHDE